MSLIDDLISYFKYDQSSGNDADSHGSVILTDVNTVGSGVGKINTARSFVAASSEYFTGGDVLDFEKDSPRSISVWLNPTSLTGEREIVSKRDASGNNGWAAYAAISPNGRPGFQLRGASGRDLIVESNTGISTGVFSHLVFTYSGVYTAGSSVKIYINGSEVGTTTVEATLTAGDTNLNSGAFTIGARSQSAPTNFYDGLMDEMGIWGAALSAADVTELHNGSNALAYPFAAPADLARRTRPAPISHTLFHSRGRQCELFLEP